MLKRIINSFLLLTLTYADNILAAESSDHKLYQENPKTYYANHSASKHNDSNAFTGVPPGVIVKFSHFLDLNSCLAYLKTCRQVNRNKAPILVAQIPNMYAARGRDVKDAFFPFPHPDWTPWKLPDEIALKLHQCYFEALKLTIPHILPPDEDSQPGEDFNLGLVFSTGDSQIIRERFRLMYSAALGGHMLAAEMAGDMLLNPVFNNIIPVVPQFKDLAPEAKVWDVCRLNKPKISNPELLEIVDRFYTTFPRSKSKYLTSHEVEVISLTLQELSTIIETEETKVMSIFLTEALAHNKNGLDKFSFRPLKTVAFVRKLGYTPSFVQLFVDKDEIQDPVITTDIPTFNDILCGDYIRHYIDTLGPYTAQITPIVGPDEPNVQRFRWDFYCTPSGQEAMRKVIESTRVAILLGERMLVRSMMSVFDHPPSQAFEDAWLKYGKHEQKINTFLYHIMLTRKPEASKFKKIYMFLKYQMGNNDSPIPGLNPSRLKLMCQEFGMIAKW